MLEYLQTEGDFLVVLVLPFVKVRRTDLHDGDEGQVDSDVTNQGLVINVVITLFVSEPAIHPDRVFAEGRSCGQLESGPLRRTVLPMLGGVDVAKVNIW